MNDHFRLSSMKDGLVTVNQISVPSNVKGMLIKGISNGRLWFCSYDDVTILRPMGKSLEYEQKIEMANGEGETCKITSLANTCVSPVVSSSLSNPCGIPKPEMIQVDYGGVRQCIIALGNFKQVTASIHQPDTIYCLRCENYITVFKYVGDNGDNKWIHMRDIFLNKINQDQEETQEYHRIQIRENTILLGSNDSIDEIDIDSGNLVKHHFHPDIGGGMRICCVDEDGTAFVVDMDKGGLYLLDRDSNFTKITTDITLTNPHDATICDKKLYVIRIENKQLEESENQPILYVLEKD